MGNRADDSHHPGDDGREERLERAPSNPSGSSCSYILVVFRELIGGDASGSRFQKRKSV